MLTTKFIRQRAILFISLLLVSKITLANVPIHVGHTTSLVNEVIARTAEMEEQRLQLNDKVFFKQQVITKNNANAVVTFRDGSTFVIAPNSVVLLDEFIFNPAENVSEKSITLLKGTLRYISGIAIKNAKTEIKTPFGTAGIRGSLVDANADQKNKTLTIAVGNGEAKVTSANGQNSQTFTPGQSGQSSNNNVNQSTVQQTAQNAQFFQNTLGGGANSANPGLTNQQAAEDAKANNTPASAQKQAAQNTKEVAVKSGDVKGPDSPSPQDTKITGDPKTIVSNYTQNSKDQNNLQSAAATVKIVEAAIKDNPSAAVAITATAVAANPKLAAAITTAAVTAAPNSAAAITTAAVTAAPDSAPAITTAAVTVAPDSAASITTAAVKAAPASAPAITTAAVTVAPTAAIAITKAAITAAPASAASITTASTAAINAAPSSPNTPTALAVVSSAVVTLQNTQNPSTTSSSSLATAVIETAVANGAITTEQATVLKTQLKITEIANPKPVSPN